MSAQVREEHLRIAIAWLENNEGEGIEKEACAAVATLLQKQINDRVVRMVSRGAGITMAKAREALAKRSKL